jgi:hypothetical protein
MNMPPESPSLNERGTRLKGAAIGFGVSVAPILAIASAQILLAPNIVEAIGGFEGIEAWVVSTYRGHLLSFYPWIVLIVFVYWMLVLALGRGRIIAVKSANLALGGSILAFAIAMVIVSVVPVPSQLFKWACPIAGLADTYSGFGFDVPTPCEAVLNRAAPTVLLGLPLVLLVASAIMRIVVSRRRWQRSGG